MGDWSDLRGAENDTVDSVVEHKVAAMHNRFVRSFRAIRVFDIIIDGGSDAWEFSNTWNSYFQAIWGLDIVGAMGEVWAVVEDD